MDLIGLELSCEQGCDTEVLGKNSQLFVFQIMKMAWSLLFILIASNIRQNYFLNEILWFSLFCLSLTLIRILVIMLVPA